jgi:ribosomal protein S8
MEGMMEVSKTLTQLQNCSNNKYAQNLLKYSNIKNMILIVL